MPVRGDGLPFELPVSLKREKKKLPVRKEFDYSPIGSFRNVNPYDIAFCYPHPLYHRPFIVKGGNRDVTEYLKKLNIPMVVHHTFYKGTRHRRIVELYGVDKELRITKSFSYDMEGRYTSSKKFQLMAFRTSYGGRILAEFKRIPRRWIRELNLYVTVERRFP